jgi:hypothetical protein
MILPGRGMGGLAPEPGYSHGVATDSLVHHLSVA